MKNRMTGIILIAIGALLLGIGTFVYSTSNKRSPIAINSDEVIKYDSLLEVETTSNHQATTEIKNEIPNRVEVKDNELEKVIEMAIADGVLTANERELIKKTAISKGVDYVKVLDDVEKRVELLEIDSETELVNLKYKNGLDFEKFIVQKFDKDFFKLKVWAGDKYDKGVYSETSQNPDLLWEYTAFKKNIEFAVECKWRQNIYMKGIEFTTTAQLSRYKDYAKKKNVPVFMAIGLGGKAASPERLFIIPLKSIIEPFMLISELKKYEKKDLAAKIFFDYKKIELR